MKKHAKHRINVHFIGFFIQNKKYICRNIQLLIWSKNQFKFSYQEIKHTFFKKKRIQNICFNLNFDQKK